MSREAMQMALEALDSDNPDIQLRAAIALRQALETEQKTAVSPGKGTGFIDARALGITVLRQALVDADDTSQKRVDEKEKREHEPVAWTPQAWRQFRPDGTLEFQKIKRTPNGEWEDYTAPPKRDLTCVCGAVWEGEMMVHPPKKREWVGLTDEEIYDCEEEEVGMPQYEISSADLYAFAQAVEQALKEKNT